MKQWEDFEELNKKLFANENARGWTERCKFKQLEGVMGLWGREDPEGPGCPYIISEDPGPEGVT